MVIAGQSPASNEVHELTNGLPFLQGKAEFGQYHPSPRYECAVPSKRCEPGDVLVSVRAPVGDINVADQAYGIGRGLAAVRAHSIDPGYLRWLMEDASDFLRAESTGSTFEAITSWDIGEVRHSELDLDVQRAMADYLDHETGEIDAMIGKLDSLVEKLEEHRRSVSANTLAELFDGENVPLWSVLTPIKDQNHAHEEVLSVYRDYGVILKNSRDDNYNRTPADLSSYQLVRPGDVVINKMKAWQGSLGVSAYRGIVSPDYQVARPIGEVVPAYLHSVLRSPLMVPHYRVRSRGVRPAQWRLYWEDFANLRIPLPPLGEQRRISDQLDQVTQKIDAMLGKVAKLQELLIERRSALITDVVTGKKEVA